MITRLWSRDPEDQWLGGMSGCFSVSDSVQYPRIFRYFAFYEMNVLNQFDEIIETTVESTTKPISKLITQDESRTCIRPL